MDENAQQAADVQTNTEPAPQEQQDLIQQAQAPEQEPEKKVDAQEPTEQP